MTRRIEYVFSLPEFMKSPEEISTIPWEQALCEFINEMWMWSYRYLLIGNIVALNVGYLTYHTIFWNLYMVARMPLAFVVGFIVRNYVLKKSIDRIYYPLDPIFKQYRAWEKQTES